MTAERFEIVEQQVRRVSKRIDDGFAIEPDTSLLTKELLDSVELMELISALEEKFSVTIPLEELTPENFETVRTIAELVQRCETSNG